MIRSTACTCVAATVASAAGAVKEADRPTVEIVTSVGSMTAELRPDEAPRTVENFLLLVDEGFYEGTIFHRVIAGFVVQAGGFDAKLNHRPSPRTVVNESAGGLANQRGTLAMARTPDPDSASSQFYINLVDNPALDATPGKPGYTVFGSLIAGQDVAEAIASAETGTVGARADVPLDPITIVAIRRID